MKQYLDILENNEEIIFHLNNTHKQQVKPFKCKGKGHQYKEVRKTVNNMTHVTHVCSCGKTLN